MCGIIIIVLSSLEMSLEIYSATVYEWLCWLNPCDLFISVPLTDKSRNYLSFFKKSLLFLRTNRAYRGGWGLATKALASTTCKTSSSHERFAVLFVCFCFTLVLRALYMGSVVMEKILWFFLGSNSKFRGGFF